VLATESTVRGGAYRKAIQALRTGAQIVQQACPLFVPLAEEGLVEGPIAELIAGHYLAPLFASRQGRPRCVVLGCTHFPVLKNVIAKAVGPDVTLVDSAATTADAVARLLAERGLARDSLQALPSRFLATDAPERFARVGEIFLGRAISPASVELVDLQAG
jgi:glutamate racemase